MSTASINNRAIVIGASAGGPNAIAIILRSLPADYMIPIIIAQHVSPQSSDFWITTLNKTCELEIKEADEKEPVQSGMVYFAPPNYHLLVEHDRTLSLSAGEKVNFSRPSIDVLFETASDVFRQNLIGIILSGASKDGASGIKMIKENGGITIAQRPDTAESRYMPEAAIATSKVDHILPIEGIAELLLKLNYPN